MRFLSRWLNQLATRRGSSRRPDRKSYPPRLEVLEDRLVPTKLLGGFVEAPVASALSNPTAMEVAPDGRIFVAEQGGALKVIKNGTLLAEPFVTITVDSGPTPDSERGLLGIAFDPDFQNNNFVYVYYTNPDGGFSSHNRVSRFTADGDVAMAGSEQVVFDALPPLGEPYHNGGAIHFGLDDKLYVGVGENFVSANAQSLDTLLGKVLRINSDGSIPDDNPFFNDANVTGDNKAICAYGLRNPFTFAVDPDSGDIYINDVGEETFEEINEGIAGANYGWPDQEGAGTDPDFTDPLFAYKHTGKVLKSGCAIAGGTFYRPAAAAFPQKYVGDYFFADLCNGWIRAYDPAKGKAAKFAMGTPDGLVDIKTDPDGSLLYLARGSGSNTGVVNRISRQSARAAAPRSHTEASVILAVDPNLKDSTETPRVNDRHRGTTKIEREANLPNSELWRDNRPAPSSPQPVAAAGMSDTAATDQVEFRDGTDLRPSLRSAGRRLAHVIASAFA